MNQTQHKLLNLLRVFDEDIAPLRPDDDEIHFERYDEAYTAWLEGFHHEVKAIAEDTTLDPA